LKAQQAATSSISVISVLDIGMMDRVLLKNSISLRLLALRVPDLR